MRFGLLTWAELLGHPKDKKPSTALSTAAVLRLRWQKQNVMSHPSCGADDTVGVLTTGSNSSFGKRSRQVAGGPCGGLTRPSI